MSSKKKSKPSKHTVRSKVASGKTYSPRPGSVPGWIYKNLAERPMLFGELSVHVGRSTGMSGDNLASQLSAALRDLVVRGAVVRLHHETQKPVPGSAKNARGVLYSLVPSAKASYLAAQKEGPTYAIKIARAAAMPREVFGPVPEGADPKQLDLGTFGDAHRLSTVGSTSASIESNVQQTEKPARMSQGMFAELKRAEYAARSQITAIELMLKDPAWL